MHQTCPSRPPQHRIRGSENRRGLANSVILQSGAKAQVGGGETRACGLPARRPNQRYQGCISSSVNQSINKGEHCKRFGREAQTTAPSVNGSCMTAVGAQPSSPLGLSLRAQGPATPTSPGSPRKTHVDKELRQLTEWGVGDEEEQGSGQALGYLARPCV